MTNDKIIQFPISDTMQAKAKLHEAVEYFCDCGWLYQGYADDPSEVYKAVEFYLDNPVMVEALLEDNFTIVEHTIDDGYTSDNAEGICKEHEDEHFFWKIKKLRNTTKTNMLLWDTSKDSPLQYDVSSYKEVAEIMEISTEKLRKMRTEAEPRARATEHPHYLVLDEKWHLELPVAIEKRFAVYKDDGSFGYEYPCLLDLSKSLPVSYKQAHIALRENGGQFPIKRHGKMRTWIIVDRYASDTN